MEYGKYIQYMLTLETKSETETEAFKKVQVFNLLSLFSLFKTKGKNSWNRPVAIFLAVIAAVIIIMVAISVVQNKPLHQKYKV